MKKTLAIIGKGTAGCYAAGFFCKQTDWNVDWYYDNTIPPQSVGEGSTLTFPDALYDNIDFLLEDLPLVDGNLKSGILKEGWTDNTYTHGFPPPHYGYHFNAVKLQNLTVERLKEKYSNRIRFINQNINVAEVEADYIMDCSGKPVDYGDCNLLTSIPVNSVYVTQCPWDKAEFDYTLATARPHGWVFGIPLQNRCSVGYMYNNTTSTLEQIKEDAKIIFEQNNLKPSEVTNNFSFKNYYRKNNFIANIAYNGNNSFFLEPLEATSIDCMQIIQQLALEVWTNKRTIDSANIRYIELLKEVETVIMMHYYASTVFESPFWTLAKQQGNLVMRESMKDPRFVHLLDVSHDWVQVGEKFERSSSYPFGTWYIPSFRINLDGLGIYKKLKSILLH
jgi:tryptophan halogenase